MTRQPSASFTLLLLPAAFSICTALFAGDDLICSPQGGKSQISEDGTENYLRCLKEARVEQIKLRLDVPEERANAIAAKWAALEAPIRRMHREAMAVWRRMQFVIQEATPEKEKSRRIKPLFDNYIELRRELGIARQKLFTELPASGDSPIQQARLLLLMEEMERREREGIRARMPMQRRRHQVN